MSSWSLTQILEVLLSIVFLTFQPGRLHLLFSPLLPFTPHNSHWSSVLDKCQILIFFTEAVKLLISESFEATVAKTSWFALDYFEKHYNNGSIRNWWHWLIEKTKHCFHWICVELNPSKRSKHWSWISV